MVKGLISLLVPSFFRLKTIPIDNNSREHAGSLINIIVYNVQETRMPSTFNQKASTMQSTSSFRFFWISLFALICGFQSIQAQTTYVWDCSSASAATSGSNANVTVGTWAQGNVNGAVTMIGTTSASSVYAGASGTSNFGNAARTGALATGASGSAYFEITLTPASGFSITLTDFSMGSRSTSTGPQAYAVRTSTDSYASDVATGTLTNNSTWGLRSNTGLTASGGSGSAVTYRIYGYNGAGNAGANTANWRVDDIKLTVTLNSSVPTPVITGSATATAFTTTYGTASTAQSFAVSGSNLTANLVATAPTGFEVSADGTTYGSTATFTQSAGSASGTLRVRLAATAAVSGSYNSQNIVLSSTGAANVNITTAATGNSVSAKALTIIGLAASDKNFDGNTTASVTGTAAFSGLVNSESFTPAGTVTWAFADANVGNNKTLVRTGSYSTPSSNYTLTQPNLTASIIGVVPTAPTINSITAGDGQVTISFTAPSSNGGVSISNYAYSLDNGSSFTAFSPVQTASPLIVTGLTNGVTYSIVIRAINSVGNGASSNMVSQTPVASSTPVLVVNTTELYLSTISGSAGSPDSLIISASGQTNSSSTIWLANEIASEPLEFSLNNINWENTLFFNTPTGTLNPTKVYVRMSRFAQVSDFQAQNNPSYGVTCCMIGGNINIYHDGDPVIVSGNCTINPKIITVTNGLTVSNKIYDGNTDANLIIDSAVVSNQIESQFLFGDRAEDFVNLLIQYQQTAANFQLKNASNNIPAKIQLRDLFDIYNSVNNTNGNYLFSDINTTANITPAPVTVTGAVAADKTYDGTTSASITAGTLLGVVSGDTVSLSNTGQFAAANAGTGIAVTVSITGSSASNYTLTQPGITANINKVNQTISFSPLPSKTVGDANFAPGATSTTSGINLITYTSSNTAVATIVSGQIQILSAGNSIITASQAGNENYNAATSVSQTLVVVPAPLPLPNMTDVGVTYIQNFNSMATTATAALPSGFKIGSNWNTGVSNTTTVNGTGFTGGGIYNFGSGTSTGSDRAIGFLNTGSFTTPDSIILKITNNTGSAISTLEVSFDYEKYRSGSRAFDWTFFHGDNAAPTIAATDGNHSFPADANNTTYYATPLVTSKSFVITGLSIPNGSDYYLRWTLTGVGGSSNGQAIGIDNISLKPRSLPTLASPTATSVTTNSATLSATVSSFGSGTTLINRGTTLNTTGTPTVSDDALNEGGTTLGSFTQIRNLLPQTRYFFRGYATTSEGIGYSNQVEFFTLSNPPVSQPSSLSATPFSSNQIDLSWAPGDFPASGASAQRYLLLRATDPNLPVFTGVNGAAPTVDSNTTIVNANIASTAASATGLTGGVTYNFLLIPYTWDGTNSQTYNYLTTGAPTVNGTTSTVAPPVLTTTTVTNITNTTARLGATITSDGGEPIVQRGTIYSTSSPVNIFNNTLDDGLADTGTYTMDRVDLTPETKYYFAGYAVNNGGALGTSPEASFYTLSNPPVVAPSNLTATPITGTQIQLSWTTATFPSVGATSTNYVLLRAVYPNEPNLINTNGQSTLPDSNTTIVSTLINGTATTTLVNGLSGGTRYNFKLVPFTWNGTTDSTRNFLFAGAPVSDATTFLTAPASQPSVAFVSNVTCNSATLTWRSVAGVSGYLVLRATGTTAPDTDPISGTVYSNGNTLGNAVVAYVGADTTTALAGLTDATRYQFEIYAYNGTTSSTISYNTTFPRTATLLTSNPAAPVATAATGADLNQFTANWNAVNCATNGYFMDVSIYPEFFNPADTLTTLAAENFENAYGFFTATGTGFSFIQGSSTGVQTPPNSPLAFSGTYALGVTTGTTVLTSPDINTSTFTSNSLTMKAAAFNGLEAGDRIIVEVSPNGGSNWYNTLTLTGNSNASWAYTSANSATVSYDGDSITTSFNSTSSTITVNNLPQTTNLRVRITVNTDGGGETWALDQFRMSGRAASFVAPYNNLAVAGTSQVVSGLTNNTNYYYRVRAAGTSFSSINSNTITATTASGFPTLVNPVASNISNTGADLGATIEAVGVDTTILNRGTVYKTTAGVLITDNVLAEGGTLNGSFTQSRTGLNPQTRYFYRAYATNSYGTGLSTETSFFTLSNPPASAASSLTATTFSSDRVNLSWSAATLPASGASSLRYVILSAVYPAVPSLSNANASGPVAASGSNIVGVSSTTSIQASGLTGETRYNFIVVPYTWNGTDSATINYLTADAPLADATTFIAIDALPPSNLQFNSISCSSMNLSWSNGTGAEGTIVLMSTGATAPNTTPSTGVAYTIGSVLGNASVVYAGVDSMAPINALLDNTTHRFTLYTYKTTASGIAYLLASPLNGSQNTTRVSAPTALSATSIDTTSFVAIWNSASCAASYKLFVYATNSGNNVAAWTFPTTGTSLFTDSSLSNSNNIGNNRLSVVPSTTITSGSGATTFAAVTTGWNTAGKYWQAIVNASSYNDIKVSSVQQSSATGPRDFKLQYRVRANGTWTDVSGATNILVQNNTTSGVLNNVALPAECNKVDSLYLRWILTSTTNVGGTGTSSTGTSRIDNIFIRGNVDQTIAGYNGVTVSGTSTTVTGLNPNTTYYYHVTSTGTSGSTSDSSNVITVRTPVPCRIRAVAASDTSICAGGSIALRVNFTGSNGTPTYLWNGPNGYTSTTQNPNIPSVTTLQAGQYTIQLTDTAGCISRDTMVVNVRQPSTSSQTLSVCGNYLWNGTTYTTSGTYTWNGTNSVGCDSVATLNLTIRSTSATTETLFVCGSYLWNGTTYTTSGTYTWTGTNAAGCDSVVTLNLTVQNCATTLNLTAFLEGNYLGNGTMQPTLFNLSVSSDSTATDSITVQLYAASTPVSTTPDYTVGALLHTNGSASVTLPSAVVANSYYVVIKHRNHLELWSANPVLFSNTTSYDFSSSLSTAFGDGVNPPMRAVSGGKFALYSGDVNQDGTIDIFDLQIAENDASNFSFGYNASDVNGEGNTDIFDLQLIEINSGLYPFVAKP